MLSGQLGCQKTTAAPPPPPPAVTVSHPLQKDVIEWDTYTGYLQAPDSVSVVARVSGLVTEAPFHEGSIVKKGDLLFRIDERPFKADLDSKVAAQEKAESEQANAKITYDRLFGLRKDSAVSQQDVDNAKAALDQAIADVAAAKAAVETSALNLDWCRVLSPINGRVSERLVTVGNLVNFALGQATQLTTIQSVSPMYCYVDIDEHSVLKYQNLVVAKKYPSSRDGKVPCYVQIDDETGFPHAGYIDFVDNHVDATTGTLRERAVLDNSSGLLTPGFFARLTIPGSDRHSALLVPDTVIGNDQSERTILLVNDQNVVEARPVQLGALFGALRAITSGLKPDDRVIINGQMHARPGAVVAPSDGEIKVDPAAFFDPDPPAAGQISQGDPNTSEQPASVTPTTEPATGSRP